MNAIPFLIVHSMLDQGCHQSVAERVFLLLQERSERQNEVLWLKMQGYGYQEIAAMIGINRGRAWHIINDTMRRSIYSVIERSTVLPATEAVS